MTTAELPACSPPGAPQTEPPHPSTTQAHRAPPRQPQGPHARNPRTAPGPQRRRSEPPSPTPHRHRRQSPTRPTPETTAMHTAPADAGPSRPDGPPPGPRKERHMTITAGSLTSYAQSDVSPISRSTRGAADGRRRGRGGERARRRACDPGTGKLVPEASTRQGGDRLRLRSSKWEKRAVVSGATLKSRKPTQTPSPSSRLLPN